MDYAISILIRAKLQAQKDKALYEGGLEMWHGDYYKNAVADINEKLKDLDEAIEILTK